ncbi:MAG TPA: hypothetical protein VJK04_01870 [Candidatus Paceibacterota bacterium]
MNHRGFIPLDIKRGLKNPYSIFSNNKLRKLKINMFKTRPRSLTGFTLIEILVGMTLFAFVGSLLALGNLDMYRGFTFRSEASVLVALLQRARSQAMNNICLGSGCVGGKPHGLVIQTNKFVIFQGDSYATRDVAQDEEIAANANISHSGPGEVVFSQLAATSSVNGDINITNGQQTSTISINNEGRISW